MRMLTAAARTVLCRATLIAVYSGTLFPVLAGQASQRTYKASAYITVFSIPIFSRSDVGYGSAREQDLLGAGSETVDLEFVSGSIPERAHGLNRFGYIQESVDEKDHTPVRANYFGVITANREESFNDAKAALNAQNAGQMPYVAASAQIENHRAHSSIRHLILPAPRESGTGDMMRIVKASFGAAPANALDSDNTLSVPTTHTFLYSVRDATLSPATTSRSEFLYNAKTYYLQTEKHRDPKVELEMHHRGLADPGAPVVRLSATIENELTHERTPFTLWYQGGNPSALPLRFEFRPKSYLRLVFDAQPDRGSSPALAALPNGTAVSFK